MEFLRFGSQIPGFGVGCCAVDVIQGFDCSPSAMASMQIVNGDQGTPCTDNNGDFLFVGPTNLDVFKQRLRIGTFYHNELENHAFLAVLTGTQLSIPYGSYGREWLAILKEHGFEFIRAINNSVYGGGLSGRPPVYLFGLFRNIGKNAITDAYVPPKEWTDLPVCTLSQKEVWDRDTLRFMSEDELRKAGVPVYLSGQRGQYPRIKEPPTVEAAVPDTEMMISVVM